MSGTTNDPARTPSLALLFRLALERRLSEMHTAIPGRVEKYDKDKQTVDVQPLVKVIAPKEGGDTEAETLPVLSSIPVEWPGAGGVRLVLPLKQGDTGRIVFHEASIDAWQQQGGVIDPGDARRFHLSDATFVPGLKDATKPWTVESGDDASFGKDGAHQVVITADLIEIGGNGNDRPTDFVALAPATKSEVSKVRDALNAFVNTFNEHTHNVETAGTAVKQSGTTVPPGTQATNPDAVGDVAATKVKAK